MSSDYSFIIFYCHFNYILLVVRFQLLYYYLLVLCSSYANIEEEEKLNKKQLDKREIEDWTGHFMMMKFTHTPK